MGPGLRHPHPHLPPLPNWAAVVESGLRGGQYRPPRTEAAQGLSLPEGGGLQAEQPRTPALWALSPKPEVCWLELQFPAARASASRSARGEQAPLSAAEVRLSPNWRVGRTGGERRRLPLGPARHKGGSCACPFRAGFASPSLQPADPSPPGSRPRSPAGRPLASGRGPGPRPARLCPTGRARGRTGIETKAERPRSRLGGRRGRARRGRRQLPTR